MGNVSILKVLILKTDRIRPRQNFSRQGEDSSTKWKATAWNYGPTFPTGLSKCERFYYNTLWSRALLRSGTMEPNLLPARDVQRSKSMRNAVTLVLGDYDHDSAVPQGITQDH